MPIYYLCFFIAIIHLIATLSYGVRIAGARTGKVAFCLSLFNILVLVSRTSNTLLTPALSKRVESSLATAAQTESTKAATHSDPRVPSRDRCVVRYLIDRWAHERSDQPYVLFDGGKQWTYEQLREKVVAVAVGLQQQGVQQGDHVLCWQPNTPEMLLTYYALNYLGAVYVPINTAYRGGVLEHVIDNSDAKLAVVTNPKGAKYADIVKSAERCAAGCVHPGTPWDAGEKNLEKLIARAKKFN